MDIIFSQFFHKCAFTRKVDGGSPVNLKALGCRHSGGLEKKLYLNNLVQPAISFIEKFPQDEFC
jgi:hypothetical protein